jgi:CHAT domain-containing protein/tetratricopeptide (TPR) repeat protein
LLTDEHPDTATSYNNVAYNLNAQGKYALAQPLYEKALSIRRRLLTDDHPRTAQSYDNLAANFNSQGNYAVAQALYEKALEIHRRLLTDEHPFTAITYNDMAANLRAQGKYALAQPLFEKALGIRRRLLTDDHPDTAVSYNDVALNLMDQGKYAQAQPLWEKSLEIRRRLLTDDHPETATSYSGVAANLNHQGKYAQAQPLYQKALEINRRLLGDDHPNTATDYDNLAANLRYQGKYDAAQPLMEKALEIYRRLLSDDHLDTAISYYNLAGNFNAQGKYLEARDRWLSAVKSLDAARLRVAFTGLERAGRGESMRPALASVLARLGSPAEAWQALEQDLGRGLLDELAARQDRRLSAAERDRIRALAAELERLDKLVEITPNDLGKAERARAFEDLKHQRELAGIALGEFLTKLVQDHGPLAGQISTLKEIQAALPADAALIGWVDLAPSGPNAADPDGEHWGVVVRSRGVPNWIALAGTGPSGLWTNEDTALPNQVRTVLRNRPGAGWAEPGPLLARLRTQRLGPMAKALGAAADGLPPARRLIVLPSQVMAGIPIEAMLADDDTHTVSYAPSATVLRYLRQQPRPDRHAGLVAVGDPVFELMTAARSGGDKFAPLPGTRYEVEALARLFQSVDRPIRTLLATDASEPQLQRLAASGELAKFGFIHLATHGVIDEEIPALSAVILTQTGLPDPLQQALNHQPVFDGRLLVREIQHDWELKAELVTLSACETALGREAGGEGFVGFTQALLMSGTRSVCLSLWKVDDTATALMMQRFYANLLGHRPGLNGPMPKAEALSEAKTWLRELRRPQVLAAAAELSAGVERGKGAGARQSSDGGQTKPLVVQSQRGHEDRPYAAPYFWAAFVLVGDPD